MSGETLGHGDHWDAIYENWGDKIAEFIPWLAKSSLPKAKADLPWPDSEMRTILHMEILEGDVALTCLLGMVESEKALRFLSCYPRLLTTTEWKLNVTGITDAYGPAEGYVELEVPEEHAFNAFAPLFAIERPPLLVNVEHKLLPFI